MSRAPKLAALAALVASLIGVSGEAAVADTGQTGCPTVWFLGARGSGEAAGPDGLGATVSGLSATVAGVLQSGGVTMQTYADSYRADSVNDFIPSTAETSKLYSLVAAGDEQGAIQWYYDHNVTPYLASIKAGAATAVKDARVLNYYCPNSSLILAGYSQGAMVVHQAEWRLSKNYPAIAKRIVGTIVLADGDRFPNSAATPFGTATAGGEGVRSWLKENNGKDVLRPAATANVCNSGDIVCDFNIHRLYPAPSSEQAGAKVHTSYAGDPALTEAATWVADQVLAEVGAPGIAASQPRA